MLLSHIFLVAIGPSDHHVYSVLFDFRDNINWPTLLAGLAAIPTTVILLRRASKSRVRQAMANDNRKTEYTLMAVVTAIIAITMLSLHAYDQIHERLAFATGHYSVVDGTVSDYTGTATGLEKLVWFNVGGVRFQIACCQISMRFDQTPYNRGIQIIRPGEWLRITYLSPNEILRIEKRSP